MLVSNFMPLGNFINSKYKLIPYMKINKSKFSIKLPSKYVRINYELKMNSWSIDNAEGPSAKNPASYVGKFGNGNRTYNRSQFGEVDDKKFDDIDGNLALCIKNDDIDRIYFSFYGSTQGTIYQPKSNKFFLDFNAQNKGTKTLKVIDKITNIESEITDTPTSDNSYTRYDYNDEKIMLLEGYWEYLPRGGNTYYLFHSIYANCVERSSEGSYPRYENEMFWNVDFYNFKLYNETGNLLYDFVPALYNSTNKLGFINRVDNSFVEVPGSSIDYEIV